MLALSFVEDFATTMLPPSWISAAAQRTDDPQWYTQVETFRPTRPLLSGDAPLSHAGDPEAAGPPIDWGSYSFLNIKRYRQYFNVDTWVSARAVRASELVLLTPDSIVLW